MTTINCDWEWCIWNENELCTCKDINIGTVDGPVCQNFVEKEKK